MFRRNKIDIKPGQLLNPRLDGIFKSIFTQNTKESRLALHRFLEAVLDRTIFQVQVTSSGSPIQFFRQREVDYDINVIFDSGESAEIEMQAFKQNYDYAKRAEYLASRLLNSIMQKGFDWKKCRKVYQISILDFNNDSDPDFFSHYVFRKENGRPLSQLLNIYFLELRKLPELTEEIIPQLNSREKWGMLLKNADNPKKSGLVKKLSETEDGIMAAFGILSGFSLTRRLWLWQTKMMIKEADRISDLEGAKEIAQKEGLEEGIKEGRKKGIKEGLEKGLREGMDKGRKEGIAIGEERNKLEAAKNLLRMNVLTFEQISEAQGLSLETVRLLADELKHSNN